MHYDGRSSLLAGAILLLQSATAAGQGDSGCAALAVKVAGLPEAAAAHCEVHKLGGGDGTGTNEFIRIVGPASIFIVSHTYVGLRTYVIRRSIKDFIAEIEGFETTENWADEQDNGDFTVRRFDAKIRGGNSGPVACFGFSRYSGHVPNSTGYRHNINGFYCDFLKRDLAADRIDELIVSIKYDFE